MPGKGTNKLERVLAAQLAADGEAGLLKGEERVLTGFSPAEGGRGPRWLLAGEGGRKFLRMNSNSYLGLSLEGDVAAAGETAARALGTGPGAVRFISGTTRAHVDLEEELASFHGGREARQVPCGVHSSDCRLEAFVLARLVDLHLELAQQIQNTLQTLGFLGIAFRDSMQKASGVGKDSQHGPDHSSPTVQSEAVPRRASPPRSRRPHPYRLGNWRSKSANRCFNLWTMESTQLGVRPPPSR